MTMHQLDVTVLQFDVYHLATGVDLLYRGDDVVPLEPRAVRALRYLVEHHDRVLSKEELLEEVWCDVYTTDGVLKKAVSQIRRTLGDDAEQSRFIATYHGRGYRFIAPVSRRPLAKREAAPIEPAPALIPNYDQLAGRDAELATLRAGLRSALDGSPRPVLIAGESGIGKTQLVRHFRRCAIEHGALSLYARFFDDRGARLAPYELFIDLLRSAMGNSRLPLRDAIESACGVRLPAELFAESSRGAGTTATGNTGDHFRFVVPICRAWLALSRRQPVVIAFDDLQWADNASLDVLGCLMRMLDNERLMIVMMVRSDEADCPGHPVRAWLEEQASRRSYATLRLARLDEAECRTLIGTILGSRRSGEIPAEDVEALFQLTEGNPYFLVETLRLLVGTEAIVADPATGRWAWRGVRELALPETIVTAARAKIERLSPAVREVIDQAAVIGDEFHEATLCRLTGRSEPEIEQLLSEAVRSGVLSTHGLTHGEDCAFQHSLLRHVVYEAIPLRRRRELHAQAAAAIAAVHGADSDRVAEALAAHYAAAGDVRRSLEAGMRAWRAARSRSEWRRAAALIERVEETSGTVMLSRQERIDLLLAAGETWRVIGKHRQSLAALDLAVSITSAAGDVTSLGHSLFLRALTEAALSNYVEARASLLQVLDLVPQSGDRPGVARVLVHLAMVEVALGDSERATSLVGDVRASDPSPDVAALADGIAGWALVRRGRYAEGAALLEQALDYHDRIGDVRERAILLRRLHWTYLSRGQYATAIELAERARSDSATVGDVNGQARANAGIGRAHLAQGRHRDAISFLGRALEQLRSVCDAHGEAECLWLLGRARYETGALDDAGSLLSRALTMIRRIGDRDSEFRILTDLARFSILRCDVDRAAEHALAARAIADALRNIEGSALASLELARVEMARRHPAPALELVRRASKVLESLQSAERARASAICQRIEWECRIGTEPVVTRSS